MKVVNGKVTLDETELKDVEDCITSYLLCDFGVQDMEIQAQIAAQRTRVIELQKEIRKYLQED